MSLFGIDVGSSSVKVAAYSEGGELLAKATNNLTPIHPQPGWWETDPEDIWRATSMGVRDINQHPAIKKDPPKAIAVSASGRENFPADKNGNPLGNGIMGADIRGEEFEVPPPDSPIPETWCISCGHLRERMDPILRLQWWRKEKPDIYEEMHYYFGWIDYLSYKMTGRVVADQSTVSRYLVFDLETMDWNLSRIKEYGLKDSWLPEVLPWGSVIGEVRDDIAEDWGMPQGVVLAHGCHDSNSAAFGAGVYEIGTVCLVSGSYENVLIPTSHLPTVSMLLRGLSVMPHPCKAGLSVFAIHPTGNAVMNWSRDLVNVSIEEVEKRLQSGDGSPGPVLGIPYLSGSMTYWENGRKARGGLLNLTLATCPVDIVQAFMESIGYDLVNTLTLIRKEGIEVKRIRITGGGARSKWWTQLKSDLTNMPIEVVSHPEPGTLGAALLAGIAIGVYEDMEATSSEFSGTARTFQPNPDRAVLHKDRLETYQATMKMLLENFYNETGTRPR